MRDSRRIAATMSNSLDVIERAVAALAGVSTELRATDAALGAISEGVLITDENGVLQYVNAAFSRITGYAAAEILGRTCAFLQGDKTDSAVVERIRTARMNGMAFAGDILNYRKDGTVFWNELTISPVSDDSGRVTRYVGIARDVTENRRAQEELRIAAVAFESREGIMITDEKQVILRVNRAFTEITGYDEADACGKTPSILSSGRQRPDFYESLERTLLQTGTWQGEIWNRRKDGTEYLEWLIITAVHDESGAMTHYVGTFTDITERNRLEQELHRKQLCLSEAQRIAKMGSWEFIYADNRLEWSEEIYRIFEVDEAHFAATYDAFLAIVHPEDRARVDHAYRESVSNRTPYSIEHRILMRDGRVKFIVEQGETIYTDDGKPARSIGTAQDVSERKLAQQELDLSAIAFDSNQGIIISDAARAIIRVNRAFTEITGYEPHEVLGRKPSQLLGAPRHRPEYFDNITAAIASDGYWHGEVWNRRKDGSEYPILLHITAIKSPAGNITHHVTTFSDISDRKEAEQKIHHLAFFDTLTRLPNRQYVLESIRDAAARPMASTTFGALLYIDIDDFKMINDTLGHEVGDLLLQEMAARIVSAVTDRDTVARVGGDEFVVVLRNIGATETRARNRAELASRKILSHLARPCKIADYTCQCTVSIGVTLIGSDGADSVESILKRADLAMFHAKSDGRSGIRFFCDEMHAAVKARASLEAEIRAALSEQRFGLFYQPQVNNDGRIVGAEALLRLLHPEKGVMAPGEFVSLAEDIGLMVPIGDWVLDAACEQLQAWSHDPRTQALSISVNVSAQQFRKGDLIDKVRRALLRTGANPERLKLELTETLLLNDVEATIDQMKAMNRIGITFCLDDFGTGCSSLSYLRRLPIHHLKIDKSFVQDIPDSGACAFVRTILALARHLGLVVIAEGVGNAAQRDFLKNAGCDLYQGYHFGRPMPMDEFKPLLH